jgi:preprotein translocase subunit SecE
MIGKIKNFVGEVSKEMKKVSWPTKEQLKESTWVVIITTAILTAFIFGIDTAVTEVIKFIFTKI